MRHSLGTIAWRGLKGRRRDTADDALRAGGSVCAALQRCCAISRAAAAPWRVQRQDLYGARQLALVTT